MQLEQSSSLQLQERQTFPVVVSPWLAGTTPTKGRFFQHTFKLTEKNRRNHTKTRKPPTRKPAGKPPSAILPRRPNPSRNIRNTGPSLPRPRWKPGKRTGASMSGRGLRPLSVRNTGDALLRHTGRKPRKSGSARTARIPRCQDRPTAPRAQKRNKSPVDKPRNGQLSRRYNHLDRHCSSDEPPKPAGQTDPPPAAGPNGGMWKRRPPDRLPGPGAKNPPCWPRPWHSPPKCRLGPHGFLDVSCHDTLHIMGSVCQR